MAVPGLGAMSFMRQAQRMEIIMGILIQRKAKGGNRGSACHKGAGRMASSSGLANTSDDSDEDDRSLIPNRFGSKILVACSLYDASDSLHDASGKVHDAADGVPDASRNMHDGAGWVHGRGE